LCYCGANGCWEALASGNAVGLYARSQAAGVSTLLLQKAGDDLEKIDAALVSEAAREGDPLAQAVVERTATYLALGLVNLLHLFLPDCVVFTGGVMRSMDLFEPRLHEVIKQHSIMNPIDQIPLRMAQLGQQAGIIGAAKAAMNEAG
jgi:glucokinase